MGKNTNKEKPAYVREQKGHSLVKHILFGWALLWIPAIYYTVSKNHYWHAQSIKLPTQTDVGSFLCYDPMG